MPRRRRRGTDSSRRRIIFWPYPASPSHPPLLKIVRTQRAHHGYYHIRSQPGPRPASWSRRAIEPRLGSGKRITYEQHQKPHNQEHYSDKREVVTKLKLQIALDTIDLARALNVASQTVSIVDRIEVGTPLLRRHGMRAIESIRAKFQDAVVVADCKIMDYGDWKPERLLGQVPTVSSFKL